jgi:HAMP domain-containing protein
MDLRTKLVLALVAVALGSMLALGLASYPLARDLLRASALRTLDGVAESKANDLDNLSTAWRDRVSLIASRTQLRMSVAAYHASRDPADRDLVLRILDDARRSAPAVRTITAYDADGRPVATTGGPMPAAAPVALSVDSVRGIAYAGLRRAAPDSIDVVFTAPLDLDGQHAGTLEVVLAAHELLDIAGDRTGLGETGEIVLAERIGADSAVIVNAMRHAAGSPLARRVGLHRPDDPVALAVLGHTRGPPAEAVDYRGETVWAATRFMPGPGWGLVVKFDAAEQEQPVLALRRHMVRVALALSAFAVLTGTILGLSLAGPIRELADVANRIRNGEVDARAQVHSHDEIGALAHTFNLMAAKLIETNRELERRVEGNDSDREASRASDPPPDQPRDRSGTTPGDGTREPTGR